jgi:hypothetical protein
MTVVPAAQRLREGLRVQSQFGLHRECQASLGSSARPNQTK